jgi:hypothetical protein
MLPAVCLQCHENHRQEPFENDLKRELISQ